MDEIVFKLLRKKRIKRNVLIMQREIITCGKQIWFRLLMMEYISTDIKIYKKNIGHKFTIVIYIGNFV